MLNTPEVSVSVENEGSLLPALVVLNPLVDDWCSLTWAWKQSEFQSEETSGRQKKPTHMSFTLKLNVNFRELKKEGHFHYKNFLRALK